VFNQVDNELDVKMASLTTTAQLVSIRDKLLLAIGKLAEEGVTSYSIGDQTFSLADVGDLLNQVERLDKLIALKDRTLGLRGRNRIDLMNYNG
tara:strand:+ start:1397 stop:1675 length:279 start_codon:yes stop_codon:yes gene_type:complete